MTADLASLHAGTQVLLLLAVAAAVAVLTRRLKLPYTVGLVAAGLALSLLPLRGRPALTRELLFAVALPGLLFEAALQLREEWLDDTRATIALLAVPGVVLALGATALLLLPVLAALVPGVTALAALAFAAATVATDPIAVVAVFRELKAPRRLAVIVEGESLLNDGTGVVVFNLVVAAAAGAPLSLPGAAARFLLVSGGGAVAGLMLGLLVVQVSRRLDDPMLEVTLSIIAAYGSFLLAEALGVSGVIATVVAGLVCGRGARSGAHAPAALSLLHGFWEFVAFALNSLVFLLIGLQVRAPELLQAWKPIVAGYAAMTLVRFAIVFATIGALRPTRERTAWSWAAVISWSGLRGALAMVLATSLPDAFPSRALVIEMTYGVVVLSICLQGLTIGPLLRRLGVRA